ncbi:MAG: imidazolonepropionase [Oligoflexia bacterium]|nr:imidazolonepropionase [Oligoflexia bacterium]
MSNTMPTKNKIIAYRDLSQIVTMAGAYKKNGRNLLPQDLSIIENASVVFDQEKIIWIGPEKEFPLEFELTAMSASNSLSIESHYYRGHVLTPELVDSHTHLVFGGDRSNEYALRLNGANYQEIADAGGGILYSMKETNRLSAAELFALAKQRIETMATYGIGTIEIKSGYGLNYIKEREISEVIFDLKKFFAPQVQIINTFMAAHAVPPEFSNSTQYIDEVVAPLLRELGKNSIDLVDIFHEQNYFSDEDLRKIFALARELDIPCKSHADEFNNNHGAKLAVEQGAISVDHLLQTDDEGIMALSKSNTVATLLPGTGLFLGKNMALARKFLDAGVRVAIASDYNPGSCHCDNLLLLASIAAPTYHMNLGELWAAITLNAAHALGLYDQGALLIGEEVTKNPGGPTNAKANALHGLNVFGNITSNITKNTFRPRFSLFKCNNINQITYNWGKNLALCALPALPVL